MWDGRQCLGMSRRERAAKLYMSACAGMEEKDDVRVVGRKCVLAKGTEDVVPSPACSIPSSATSFFLSFFTRQTNARSAPGNGGKASSGEPTKTVTRCRRFLFWRCFSASCAVAVEIGFGAQFRRSGRALWCAIMICIYTWIIICYHGY